MVSAVADNLPSTGYTYLKLCETIYYPKIQFTFLIYQYQDSPKHLKGSSQPGIQKGINVPNNMMSRTWIIRSVTKTISRVINGIHRCSLLAATTPTTTQQHNNTQLLLKKLYQVICAASVPYTNDVPVTERTIFLLICLAQNTKADISFR